MFFSDELVHSSLSPVMCHILLQRPEARLYISQWISKLCLARFRNNKLILPIKSYFVPNIFSFHLTI